MDRVEGATKFVSAFNEQRIKFANKEIADISETDAIDFIIDFCNANSCLREEFIDCKFNPIAFYYLCKWIIGKITESQFGKVVAELNKKVQARHSLQRPLPAGAESATLPKR